MQGYGHVSRSSGLAKTILQGTVKGGRRQGGQRKRWEDIVREWTGLEFGKSQRAVENREKWRKTGCKIICGAPTTLAVKGLMMMMIIIEQCVAHLENQILQPNSYNDAKCYQGHGIVQRRAYTSQNSEQRSGRKRNRMLAGQHEAGSVCCSTPLAAVGRLRGS